MQLYRLSLILTLKLSLVFALLGCKTYGVQGLADSQLKTTEFGSLTEMSTPWLFRLYFEDEPNRKVTCSGVHLGYGVVLTAAHCLFGYNGTMLGRRHNDRSYDFDVGYYVKTKIRVLDFITGSPREKNLVVQGVNGYKKFLIHPKYYEEYRANRETFANKKQAAFDLALIHFGDHIEAARVLLPVYDPGDGVAKLGDTAYLFGTNVNEYRNRDEYQKGYFGGKVQFDFQGGSNLYSSVASYFTRGQTGGGYLKEVCGADSGGAAVQRTEDGDVLLGILSQSGHRPTKKPRSRVECPKSAQVNLIHYHRQFIADSVRELSTDLYNEIREAGFVPDNYDVAPDSLPKPVLNSGGTGISPIINTRESSDR